jgi:hypothetical protein
MRYWSAEVRIRLNGCGLPRVLDGACPGVYMNRILRSIVMGVCLLVFAAAAHAQTVSVGTSASETAAYGSAGQSFGPWPWSALGVTASSSVSPGTLDVQTNGSTVFNLPTGTVTSGESFVPGSTVLDLGYNPGFTKSSISAAPTASSNLNANLVYNLGPFGSGTDNLLNVTTPVLGLGTANINGGLNNGIGISSLSQTTTGASGGLTLSAQAQACFIVCVTVASVSASFDVSAQTSQTVIATPTVTYGDLVWESTSQTYSASDSPVFVPGIAGNILNTFTAPSASLGLTNGETFYYNFLPVVEVNMPVDNTAEVAVPASITASYDVLGVSGSETWPLGNLYSYTTGGSFDFDPNFYAGNFYSVPLVYGAPSCPAFGIACFPATYTVPGGGGNPVSNPSGGVPNDMGPDGCGITYIGCNINVPNGPGTTGNPPPSTDPGPSFTNPTDPCEPAGVALPADYTCNTTFNQTPIPPTPEPSGVALLAVGLVGLAIISRRRLCS